MKCTNSLAVSYLFSRWRSLIYFAFCCAHTWPTKAASLRSHWSLLFNPCISSYCFAEQTAFLWDLCQSSLDTAASECHSCRPCESDSVSIDYIHIPSKGRRNMKRSPVQMAGTVPHSATCKSYLYHFTTTVSHYQIHRSQSFCFKNPTALFPMGRKNNISLSDTDDKKNVFFLLLFSIWIQMFSVVPVGKMLSVWKSLLAVTVQCYLLNGSLNICKVREIKCSPGKLRKSRTSASPFVQVKS